MPAQILTRTGIRVLIASDASYECRRWRETVQRGQHAAHSSGEVPTTSTVCRSLQTRKRLFVGNRLWVGSLTDPDGYRFEFESPDRCARRKASLKNNIGRA